MKRVFLAYREAHASTGSKRMRCDQLAELCQRFLSDRYLVQAICIPRRNREAVLDHMSGKDSAVIGMKGALKSLSPEELEEMSRRARFLGVDYVDMTTPELLSPETIKLHIGASVAGTRILRRFAEARRDNDPLVVAHLPHHADPRLRPPEVPLNVLRTGYFGEMHNTILPEAARDRVMLPEVQISNGFAALLRSMSLCGLHYAVRPPNAPNVVKPFTKGFNAAACHANILVNRDVDDALHYLGADYPYLVKDTSEDAILGALDFAQSTYRTGVWQDALEVMAGVRRASSQRRVANRLGKILDETFERCG